MVSRRMVDFGTAYVFLNSILVLDMIVRDIHGSFSFGGYEVLRIDVLCFFGSYSFYSNYKNSPVSKEFGSFSLLGPLLRQTRMIDLFDSSPKPSFCKGLLNFLPKLSRPDTSKSV